MDRKKRIEETAPELADIGTHGPGLDLEQIQAAMGLVPTFFRDHVILDGYTSGTATALVTKFRDAGRRSPPWRPTSSRVAGRPQDGADGNRRNRWEFKSNHKYFADEGTATLVEIRYFFQALSMTDAPAVPSVMEKPWEWLLGHPLKPGQYRDPIQLVPISFPKFAGSKEGRVQVTSGHFVPLDRGGRHDLDNTFLTLKRSNDLQGNMTLDELLSLLKRILDAHQQIRGWTPAAATEQEAAERAGPVAG